jgi:hypothetical protein
VFNATFNNVSVILWLSVLLVEETGENRPSHWQTLSHNVGSLKNVLSFSYKVVINLFVNKRLC